MIQCSAPVLVHADTGYLRNAIMGLYRESMGPAQPTVLDNWVELVHAYIVRLGQSERSQRRGLISVWEQVDENLAHPWTARQLADIAGVSGETLRRLCQREHGRGPMHQLTMLRMRRAAMLLESTSVKVDAIARAIGYVNAFAFSTAFKRQMGRSPAAYRAFRREERRPADAVRVRKGRSDPFEV